MKDSNQIPVRLIATSPSGDIPIRAKDTEISLPKGPRDSSTKSVLTYGPYLEAVHHLLLRNNCEKVLESTAKRLGRAVKLDEISSIEIRTEKHGACYHVARLDLNVSGKIVSLAVNVAVSDKVRSQVEQDFRLLGKLRNRYRNNFLPQVYFKGAGRYQEGNKGVKWLHMFVAEWFSGHHEFHLHRDQQDGSSRLLLWDLDHGSRYLSDSQCLEVYRQAALILTLYYNWNTFQQIYPWHHAAGDFVLREEQERVDLRLVTVRDYASVVDFKTRKRAGKLLALILFFLHLTVQMRFDRLDGVGAVVWADDYCLEGVVAGFFEGLTLGDLGARRTMPYGGEILDIFRRFSREEWLHLLEECLETYNLSQEELSLIQKYSGAHLDKVKHVLEAMD
jgi:hypothetical protein